MDSGDNQRIRYLRLGLSRLIDIASDFLEEEITRMTYDECAKHITDISAKFKEVMDAVEEMEASKQNDEILEHIHADLNDC